MNIFVVDENPIIAAQQLCNKHVIKLILEGAQLLATAHHVLEEDEAPEGIYKATHINHPCSIWARETDSNYRWLYLHTKALAEEYTFRYNRVHATKKMLTPLHDSPRGIPEGPLTPFRMAMPDQYKSDNPVESYRQYYINEKARFAKWKVRQPPEWWPFKELP